MPAIPPQDKDRKTFADDFRASFFNLTFEEMIGEKPLSEQAQQALKNSSKHVSPRAPLDLWVAVAKTVGSPAGLTNAKVAQPKETAPRLQAPPVDSKSPKVDLGAGGRKIDARQ